MLEYVLIILISSLTELFGFCKNRSISSAYKLILCVILLVLMPVILLFWRIAATNGSIKSANSEGKSGHPCLVPLWSVKLCEIRLLVMTAAFGVL